ncbi:MAG: HD domain-containing protein [Bdellovibrionales bacterium]|nr:HD domain-containing protein [Bdellovibrionales bacterium]
MENAEYLKIRLSSIHPQVPVTFDVFISVSDRMIHYLRAGGTLEAEKIENFEKKAPDNFYIRTYEKAAFKQYIAHLMLSEELSSFEKATLLRESSLALVEELYESPDIAAALNESKEVINEFVELMDRDSDAMGHLIGLSSHDFYTYNHSLDVGIYSLGLGQVAGYSGDDLRELGQGALFHDIGKRHVSVDIICKDGPLDNVEWAQMQQHPQFGLLILDKYEVSDAIKACCFEHHESFQGNGYPQQLEGHEIHPMARIVALTDTYDALTTKRSYNEPMTPTDAISFMNEKLKGRYDSDLMAAMHDILFRMEKAKKAV